MVPEHWIYRI